MMPAKSVFYGRYAQVSNGKTFDGSQLYQVLDDVKKTGSILAASVMPYGTWDGLTYKDNRNAVAIAKVCKDIQEKHGIEVWLRFAHEMNWYQVSLILRTNRIDADITRRPMARTLAVSAISNKAGM